MNRQMPFKVQFIIELIRRLHQTGTGANRLEDAVMHVGSKIGLEVDLFTSPTSVIVSIRNQGGEDHRAYRVPTRVLRLPPGDVDLGKLCAVDEIADQVVDGQISLHQGYHQLKNLPTSYGAHDRALQIAAFTLASGSVAVVFRAGFYDSLIALMVGFLIGLASIKLGGIKRVAGNFEAIAALLATFCAWAGSLVLPGIAPHLIILAGLVCLFPGLSLTTAVSELSTTHLMSGASRFAGSVMSLMKLGFGVYLGTSLTSFVPLEPMTGVQPAMPEAAQWFAVIISGISFTTLFRVRKKEIAVSILAALLGFLVARMASAHLDQGFGLFLAGLFIAAVGNLYAQFCHKPSSVVRVPGIILLVPGSLGYRAITYFLEKNMANSIEAISALIVILASLVGGLLFGNMLIPPRRSL